MKDQKFMLSSSNSDVTDEEAKDLVKLLSPESQAHLVELPERQRKRMLTQLRDYVRRAAAQEATAASGVPADDEVAFGDDAEDDDADSDDDDTKRPSEKATVEKSSKKKVAPSFSTFKSFIALFERRLELEAVSASRRKAFAARMKEEDATARRIALIFTLVVACSAIGVALYLSESRRVHGVIEWWMKWYHYFTSSRNSLGEKEDEEYKMFYT
jgi:hypothetical protein